MSGTPSARTPRQRIEAECRRRGRPALVAGCVRLIRGDESDIGLIAVLGGDTANWYLGGGHPDQRYWSRVWAARGLLWVWDTAGLDALLLALRDPAWRVREMAAKVVARHLVGDALPMVAALREDPVPRVRAAAVRAVARLTEAGA
ncbi:MAG: HEAT repeat domain-containing protein [Labedaea sp.]